MTNLEMLAAAGRLAEDDGKSWDYLTGPEKHAYILEVHKVKKDPLRINFPLWVKPPTPCAMMTTMRMAKFTHGRVRIEFQVPAKPLYVARASNNKVFPAISPKFADEPCSPECVNR